MFVRDNPLYTPLPRFRLPRSRRRLLLNPSHLQGFWKIHAHHLFQKLYLLETYGLGPSVVYGVRIECCGTKAYFQDYHRVAVKFLSQIISAQ
jgi:hypothetical protein